MRNRSRSFGARLAWLVALSLAGYPSAPAAALDPAKAISQFSHTAWTARDGALWIGYGTGGIGRLAAGRLEVFTPEEGAPPGGVLSLLEDRDGTVWAGGAYGFGRFRDGHWRRVGAALGYPAPGVQAARPCSSRYSRARATDGAR